MNENQALCAGYIGHGLTMPAPQTVTVEQLASRIRHQKCRARRKKAGLNSKGKPYQTKKL